MSHEWIEHATASQLKIRLRFLQEEDELVFRNDTWLLQGKLHMSELTRFGKAKRDAEVIAIVARLRTLESGWWKLKKKKGYIQ